MIMKTYIHKENGFWQVENLPKSYLTGKTIEDYNLGAYLPLDNDQIAFRAENPEATQMEVYYMQLSPEPVRTVEQARQDKLMQIEMYDRSEAVNTFYVNGIPDWLTPDVQSNYRNSIDSAELLQETHITFTVAQIASTLTLQDAKVILAKIQRYADNCTIVTKTHMAAVRSLSSIDEIDNYDYKVNYPKKEEFSLMPLSL